jgi:adenylate cyclase
MNEHRRLAAIVVADVVGYSRLMGRDESRTLAALRELRAARIDPLVAEYGGRIVKSMGDGVLIEFGSIVLAMRFAVRLQEELARSAPPAVDDDRLVLRVGVHQGDVIVEDDDIFGDGVNVAARLQALAPPGGVSVSQRTYEDVRDRLDLDFVDGGTPALKNIAQPIRVWHWHPGGVPASRSAAVETASGSPATSTPTAPSAALALPLPDRPSIAVLPFDNLGDDPGDAHFADGLAEDLITELSRFRELFVIARNSTFAFRSAAVDVEDVGRRLGVHYVVEGSVRRTGRRVRVTAQLIDAASGRHVWAERYDRDLDEVFAAQDELTTAIVAAIAPAAVGAASRARVSTSRGAAALASRTCTRYRASASHRHATRTACSLPGKDQRGRRAGAGAAQPSRATSARTSVARASTASGVVSQAHMKRQPVSPTNT